MEKADLYLKIEAYLQGTLSPIDREAFESELERDTSLEKEVLLHRELQSLLFDDDIEAFRSKLKKINIQSKKGNLLKIQHKWIYAAASIIIVAGVLFWFLLPYQKAPVQLYEIYFSPPEYLSPAAYQATRDNSINPDPLAGIWIELETAYQNKEFKEAQNTILSYPIDTILMAEEEFNFQLGLLSLINSEPNKAIGYFNKLTNSHQEQKLWYMALAYLKLVNVPQALIHFNKLSSFENPFQIRSREIIRKLN